MAGRRKEDTLYAYWSKRENDVMLCYPDHKWNGHYLSTVLTGPRYGYDGKQEPSFIDELDKRGFDVTTLRFSIKKKKKTDGT